MSVPLRLIMDDTPERPAVTRAIHRAARELNWSPALVRELRRLRLEEEEDRRTEWFYPPPKWDPKDFRCLDDESKPRYFCNPSSMLTAPSYIRLRVPSLTKGIKKRPSFKKHKK